MSKITSLDRIRPGESAIVSKICLEGNMKRRLYDIGLIKNTRVKCVGVSPMGDPIALLIRGAVIALRSDDCKKIFVFGEGGREWG